jgi:hypothetical protein
MALAARGHGLLSICSSKSEARVSLLFVTAIQIQSILFFSHYSSLNADACSTDS